MNRYAASAIPRQELVRPWCPLALGPVIPDLASPPGGSRLARGRAVLAELQDEFLGCTPDRCKPGAF
ncbi:MAG: hypothetical protein ACK5HY_06815, partial [Parahaliea sp.]